MIQITPTIMIDENEIHEEFIQSSGPGGQNVNKVATAVQLRFDVANSPSLPDKVRERLLSLNRKRITNEGVLVIDARRFRTQGANRQDAIERFIGLIRKAAQKPKVRRKTKPTRASETRRLEAKRHRAKKKRLRRTIQEETMGSE
jgi:ribosome-associated protein